MHLVCLVIERMRQIYFALHRVYLKHLFLIAIVRRR